jgi:pyruvate/2-oxoglutarate dehydrogenase complex dihydrolipoamide acyltransferase (E2) component
LGSLKKQVYLFKMDVGFQTVDGRHYLVRGSTRKEIEREVLIELYQAVLGRLAQNRDYTSITSISKLLKVIDLECAADDSDSEESAPAPAPTPAPAAVNKKKVEPEPEPEPVSKKAAGPRGRRPAPKNDSDEE